MKSKIISDHILSMIHTDLGDNISNIKLNILLYCLANIYYIEKNVKLFDEDFIMMEIPSLKSVYDNYKGMLHIDAPKELELIEDNELLSEISYVYQCYGQYSSANLYKFIQSDKYLLSLNMGDVVDLNESKNFFEIL